MKKTIIALFLVLLTLGLCVSCDASVDKKLLGGATSGSGAGGNNVTVEIWNSDGTSGLSIATTIVYPEGQTWESFVNDVGGDYSISVSNNIQYQLSDICKAPNLTQNVTKTEILGAVTTLYVADVR